MSPTHVPFYLSIMCFLLGEITVGRVLGMGMLLHGNHFMFCLRPSKSAWNIGAEGAGAGRKFASNGGSRAFKIASNGTRGAQKIASNIAWNVRGWLEKLPPKAAGRLGNCFQSDKLALQNCFS